MKIKEIRENFDGKSFVNKETLLEQEGVLCVIGEYQEKRKKTK